MILLCNYIDIKAATVMLTSTATEMRNERREI